MSTHNVQYVFVEKQEKNINTFGLKKEHEICTANNSQITYNCKFFLAKHSFA